MENNKILLRVNENDNPEPSPKGSNVLPLYKPKDTNLVKLEDKRKINPATGLPFKIKGTKGINANEEDIKAIISHAKAKGVDPYTALAIGLQESEFGRLDPNYGRAGDTWEDDEFIDTRPEDRNKNANILAKAIKNKLAYASELRRKGLLPAGEEFDLQTYNGLGKIFPNKVMGQHPTNYYYGIPVSDSHPLDLKKNPAYGKTVKQLREEVIRTNPKINELIENTPAYSPTMGQESPRQKVMIRVGERQ